jgi:ATP/maltotriose-dependent transcriptional regulator MalT
MSATRAEQLRVRAREAAQHNEWVVVQECMTGIDPDELTPADLDLMADADWWMANLEPSLALRQRAYVAYADLHHHRGAAFCAWYLWFDYRFMGDEAVASGWLTRAARHAADDPECIEAGYVALARAETARCGGHIDDAAAHAEQALTLGRLLNAPNLVAMATVALGEVAVAHGRASEAVAFFDDAMCSVIAGELNPLFTGLVYCGVLTACFAIADLKRASEWSRAAVAWCDSMPMGSPYHGVCRVHQAEVTTLQGAWESAEAAAQRAIEELSVLDPSAAGAAFYVIGEIRRRRGDLAGAESAYVRAHGLGHTPQPGLALLRLQQRRLDDAAALLRSSEDALPAAPLPRAHVLAAQVQIALALHDRRAAGAVLDALEDLTPSQRGRTVLDAIAAHARACVSLADGDTDRACMAARRACGLFRELRLPHEAALARVTLGEALRTAGDADGGNLELEAAHRALNELGAELDAERVATMLGSAATLRPRGLTAREVEVLRLVASGKTNREVAGEMFLSEHTVSRHLQNIFAKLDVSTRAAATAFAYQHELV